MFLRGNFMGITPLFGSIPIIPPVTLYDSAIFYGGATGAIFSKIWGRNIATTSDTVNNYTLETYIPNWTSDTYLMSLFNNSLNGGNIEGITGEVQSWFLYREEISTGIFEFLEKLDADSIVHYDFTSIKTKTYKYYLFAQDTLILSSPIITNNITSDYYGWYLIDSESNRAFRFDIDFDGGDKDYTERFSEHKTNLKTNAFTIGNTFFIEGTISAIISKDNLGADIRYTNDDLLSLQEFILSERPKLLKSRRGEIFNVFTYGYQETLLNPALSQNLYVSSFQFKEVGDL